MPRFVAVDVSFDRFVGFGVPGRKTAGNSLKRGLKWYPLGKLAPRAYSVRRDGEWPVLRLCGCGCGGLSTGKGGPIAAIFYPKLKKLLQLQHAQPPAWHLRHSAQVFYCYRLVVVACGSGRWFRFRSEAAVAYYNCLCCNRLFRSQWPVLVSGDLNSRRSKLGYGYCSTIPILYQI